MPIIRNVLLAAALVAGGACHSSTAPVAAMLAVSAVTTPSSVVRGDTARIVVTVRNLSDQTLRVGGGGCNTDFRIADAAGQLHIPAETINCSLIRYGTVDLGPHDSFQIFLFTTGRVYDEKSLHVITLPVGTYTVTGMVSVLRGDEEATPLVNTGATLTLR
jgi:hypothetical protein